MITSSDLPVLETRLTRLPLNPFGGILSECPFDRWQFRGDAVLRFGDDSYDGIVSLRMRELKITGHWLYKGQVYRKEPDYGDPLRSRELHGGVLRPRQPSRKLTDWQAPYVCLEPLTNVFLSGWHRSELYDELDLQVRKLELTFSAKPTAATRELYRGIEFAGYPYPVENWATSGRYLDSPRYIVKVFGRDAIIYVPVSFTIDAGMAVAYEGRPLVDEELIALSYLMSYLGGKRAVHIATEQFSEEGKRTAFEFHDYGGTTEAGIPPLHLESCSSTVEALESTFGAMLDRMCELVRSNHVKVNAALHHYFEAGNSEYSVTRLLLLAIAIDTLVALRVGKHREISIIDKERFAERIPPVRLALKEAFANIPADQQHQLSNRLSGINTASAQKRQQTFWESVGVVLTKAEAKTLESRHQVVHEGHVGESLSFEQEKTNRDRSAILADLFNRAFLNMLGYTGPPYSGTSIT